MQKQISSYLFQNRSCPLPGLGTLSVLNSGAEADFTNKLISAPEPYIQFVNTESGTDGLLEYLAVSTNSNKTEATASLVQFCDDLKKKINDESAATLDGIGNFSADESGNIYFKQEELPSALLQPVVAERVVHPMSEHQILVGDRETTNTIMTEMLTPKLAERDRWLIWAIILGVIGLLLLVIYLTVLNGTSPFGNAIKI